MDCEERAVLLALYLRRARSFSHAMTTLHEARDAKWPEGFMVHWDAVHEALTACIAAQDRLERHISAHQCEEAPIFEKAIA